MTTAAPLPGLYVHVPFCASKCPYCGFFSCTSPMLRTAWLDAVEREALRRSPAWPGPFDTLYLGGGTPTVLDDGMVERLLGTLRRTFPIVPGAEVTLEANPGDLPPGRLRTLRDLGVTRLSLGVQSLDDADLRLLGRRHTAAEALAAVEDARAAGFHDVGLDLMWGLPRQTEEAWRSTLHRAAALRPEHLACYQLSIEENTAFDWKRRRGKLRLPSEEAAAARFRTTSEVLAGCGYEHYEVSNFARRDAGPGAPGRRSRHNSKYWARVPYLGLGPSAHSFDGTDRWWNVRSVDGYCAALGSGKDPEAGRETLTADQARLEAVALGLRTSDGIDPALLAGVPDRDSRLERLVAEGRIVVDGERIRPTVDGMLVADRLPLELL